MGAFKLILTLALLSATLVSSFARSPPPRVSTLTCASCSAKGRSLGRKAAILRAETSGFGRVPSGGGTGSDADKPSLKGGAASALGYLITLGSCVTKLPQVKKILDSGSVEGLSLTSNYLETVSLTSKLCYHKLHGYEVSTWLENVALLIQQAMIIGLIWKLASPAVPIVHILGALGVQTAFTFGAMKLPRKYWPLLLVVKTAATLVSGGSQIWLNFVNQSTGQLAWSPVLLRIIGNSARVLTSLIKAKGDWTLLSLYFTSAALNIILGAQFFLYK